MRIQDIIAAKRDGCELSRTQISRIVQDYSSGQMPDYQMSAFLMAAYICGLDTSETIALTRAMVSSGTVLDLSSINGTKVDKHSTGGVGDKTTLVVVPVLAACGLKVPKMSGRGLGFTGGTLDKMESIPGLTTALSVDRFVAQVEKIGAAIAGQTMEIVPADKKIYALRDVTATVDNIPLIAASVMSKKIACSSNVILIDVKVGSGAFVREIEKARELARTMILIGTEFGRKVGAVITDMNQPLGRAVGNSLEVAEAIDTLKGGGPEDFRTLCVELCAQMLDIVGLCSSHSESVAKVTTVIRSGAAFDVFARLVAEQGGDTRTIERPSLLPQASQALEVKSEEIGTVTNIDCAQIGAAASILGAGRERKEDIIDPAVGVIVNKKLGDKVAAGDVLAVIHANDRAPFAPAAHMIRAAYHVADEPATVPPLIHEVVR